MTEMPLEGSREEEAHLFVLKRPTLLNSASLPVNNEAGPLNSCRVEIRRLASLHTPQAPSQGIGQITQSRKTK